MLFHSYYEKTRIDKYNINQIPYKNYKHSSTTKWKGNKRW